MEKINYIARQVFFLEKIETQIRDYLSIENDDGSEDFDSENNPEIDELRLFVREQLIKLTSYLHGLKRDINDDKGSKNPRENSCQSPGEVRL